MQRVLIIVGLLIVLVGIAWPWLSKLPLGRLPGDLVIERDNVRVYVPVVTMLVASILLSLLLWLFRR